MSLETFFASFIFAFVASATPGPNNLMLLASGVNFGFRRSIPHMIGVSVGFTVLLVATGFGMGALFNAVPELRNVLKVVGGAYLLYLAWKIASVRRISRTGDTSDGHPMSFVGAAMFQWVNPKGWVMAISAMALFTNADRPFLSVLLVTLCFVIVVAPSVSAWAGFGTALRGFLSEPQRLKWFNITMGVLLAATLLPMFA
jgi:threonine/homoserine/homoserine lactone efflux protein